MFIDPLPQSSVLICSVRNFGEPKLKKSKELHRVKQAFSVNWIYKKCKCACYVLGDDIYIKHRDFNSIEIYDHNHEFRKKFIYNDTFGSIVLRGEAWLVTKDVRKDLQNNVFIPRICWALAEQITGELGNGDWERFFERVIQNAMVFHKEVNQC